MATLRFASGFETGDFSEWDSETDTGGRISVTTDQPRTGGSYSLKMLTDGSAVAYLTQAIAATTHKYVSFWIYSPTVTNIPNLTQMQLFHDITAGISFDIHTRRNGANMELYALYGLGSTGYVAAWNTAGWHQVEVEAEDNVNLEIWVDGGSIVSAVPGAQAALTSFRFGDNTNANWAETVYLDNFELWEGVPSTSYFKPPDAASGPSPSTGKSYVPPQQSTSWTAGTSFQSDPSVTYNVYFGTTSSPDLVSSGQSSVIYDPAPGKSLLFGTTYYWRIDTIDANGNTTTGTEWTFTTGQPRQRTHRSVIGAGHTGGL